jgi:hypothetical protein
MKVYVCPSRRKKEIDDDKGIVVEGERTIA